MSALDGTLEVGDLVWQQMYNPTKPCWDASLEERITAGQTYGERRKMRLIYLHRDGIDGPCTYGDGSGVNPLSGKPMPAHSEHYVVTDPHNKDDYSITDDNWCVLEHVHDQEALW